MQIDVFFFGKWPRYKTLENPQCPLIPDNGHLEGHYHLQNLLERCLKNCLANEWHFQKMLCRWLEEPSGSPSTVSVRPSLKPAEKGAIVSCVMFLFCYYVLCCVPLKCFPYVLCVSFHFLPRCVISWPFSFFFFFPWIITPFVSCVSPEPVPSSVSLCWTLLLVVIFGVRFLCCYFVSSIQSILGFWFTWLLETEQFALLSMKYTLQGLHSNVRTPKIFW